MEVADEQLAEFFATIDPLLDERQRRMTAGAAARMLGRGGTTTVARLAHMSRNTVLTGAREVQAGEAVRSDRVRREGAGRKRIIDKDPNLLLELDDLVSPEARGDPMSRHGCRRSPPERICASDASVFTTQSTNSPVDSRPKDRSGSRWIQIAIPANPVPSRSAGHAAR